MRDKTDNLITGDRLATTGNMVHQVTDTFDHNTPTVFAGVTWRGLMLVIQMTECF
ncbi:hypothetical protein L327_0121165 [Yersinia pestis S3]|nr:hypothetical protein L327_0121165 [Yersinia pestis S3]